MRSGSDRFQPEQRPPHSEWSRCYRQSSDTGPREPPESRSGPGEGGEWSTHLHEVAAEVRKTTTKEMYGGQDERTYSGLSSDVGTAHYLGPGQRLLPLGSLPQGDQSRHVCGGTDRATVSGRSAFVSGHISNANIRTEERERS